MCIGPRKQSIRFGDDPDYNLANFCVSGHGSNLNKFILGMIRITIFDFGGGLQSLTDFLSNFIIVPLDMRGYIYHFAKWQNLSLCIWYTLSYSRRRHVAGLCHHKEYIRLGHHHWNHYGNENACLPRKHEGLFRCWFNAGPLSLTVAQHQINIGSTSAVNDVDSTSQQRRVPSG